ncbi:motile sperm domain-containing protein 2-like [Pararge aegeria]|uniref:Jg9849 protein n=1 Tax=Pararge aegeria aegeria TaxID=348720 RepID=A0A8S4RNT0_9NEOP|nr:motile sperm domain-containing protein 2-like [Pararge aegeria]CAH2238561.1 jg9849 [Pararge aegeria aegeria]
MAKIAEIRMLFEAKIKDSLSEKPGCFDTRDLERAKSDKYLYRVLEHCQNNVQLAVDMLYDIMVWRKDIGANDISHETVNMDYLKEGVFFPHGRDIDSCLLFIMKAKLYVKSQKNVEEVKKVIIYWLERIEREEDGKKITLFFDMESCGLNNMDIEVIMYMVTLLKSYYPNMINYVIVYQLPWMLSAGFKIVKGLLPAAAVERLRMISRDKLKDLVAPEQALVCWGGKDSYVFQFSPENRVNIDKTPKHVSFAEDCQSREMLLLSPSKSLVFRNFNERIATQLSITNMEESCIAFKIRTTAPEKYVVRPSTGTLTSKASQTINITVNSGFPLTFVEKDRFLVVSIKIPSTNISQKDLGDLWKATSMKADEYRLKCSTGDVGKSSTKFEKVNDTNSVEFKLRDIQESHNKLVKNLDTVKLYQIFTLFLSFVGVIFGYYAYKNIKNGYCQQ